MVQSNGTIRSPLMPVVMAEPPPSMTKTMATVRAAVSRSETAAVSLPASAPAPDKEEIAILDGDTSMSILLFAVSSVMESFVEAALSFFNWKSTPDFCLKIPVPALPTLPAVLVSPAWASTYCLVAACRDDEGSAASVSAPVSVPPDRARPSLLDRYCGCGSPAASWVATASEPLSVLATVSVLPAPASVKPMPLPAVSTRSAESEALSESVRYEALVGAPPPPPPAFASTYCLVAACKSEVGSPASVTRPLVLSIVRDSVQALPSGETLKWKSSSPARPISARPEKPSWNSSDAVSVEASLFTVKRMSPVPPDAASRAANSTAFDLTANLLVLSALVLTPSWATLSSGM